ncbi:MAG: arsenic metallochaperone ArsD family protein [Methylocella sp.]
MQDLPRLHIFEPPLSCSFGACGPDGEDATQQLEALLHNLREKGVEISRFNLGYHPKAFAENEIVKQILARDGIGALPLAILDNVVVIQGGYPTRDTLERAFERVTTTT